MWKQLKVVESVKRTHKSETRHHEDARKRFGESGASLGDKNASRMPHSFGQVHGTMPSKQYACKYPYIK